MQETNIATSEGCVNCSNCNGSYHKPFSWDKLNVFDYLKNLPVGINATDLVEVKFKNTRKEIVQNVNKLKLKVGDMVAVEASPGHDLGRVVLMGELVKEQLRKYRLKPNHTYKKIYRVAKENDINNWKAAIARENDVMLKARKIASDLGLRMKIGDVEFQGDGSKAIFYYIADGRVDFRKLIRVLAKEFDIRIEMRQIGARQEAGRIGGVGSCGRELCCSAWLTSFISVTTDAVREQEIMLNPQKMAGQCGKLKCCLNYETECYTDAKKDFPERINLETREGTAYYIKTDVYKKLMWYSCPDSKVSKVTAVDVERVREIIELNKKGEMPETLQLEQDIITSEQNSIDLLNETSITRFDKKKKKKKTNTQNRYKRKNKNFQNKNFQNNNRTKKNQTKSYKKNNKNQ